MAYTPVGPPPGHGFQPNFMYSTPLQQPAAGYIPNPDSAFQGPAPQVLYPPNTIPPPSQTVYQGSPPPQHQSYVYQAPPPPPPPPVVYEHDIHERTHSSAGFVFKALAVTFVVLFIASEVSLLAAGITLGIMVIAGKCTAGYRHRPFHHVILDPCVRIGGIGVNFLRAGQRSLKRFYRTPKPANYYPPGMPNNTIPLSQQGAPLRSVPGRGGYRRTHVSPTNREGYGPNANRNSRTHVPPPTGQGCVIS